MSNLKPDDQRTVAPTEQPYQSNEADLLSLLDENSASSPAVVRKATDLSAAKSTSFLMAGTKKFPEDWLVEMQKMEALI